MSKKLAMSALALAAATAGAVAVQPVLAEPQQPAPELASQTVVVRGTDGVFEAFRRRPLVGLGIDHFSAPGGEFYKAIIRDPRFARDVGNVVVEFAGARHQAIMDRYVAGDAVPYTELRKTWTDTVGWGLTSGNESYVSLFAEVRDVNRTLPPNRRIRVWLGEPPVDWSKISSNRQWDDGPLEQRDSYPAGFISRDILGQQKRALVIYGNAHFEPGTSLVGNVEKDHPDSFFLILGGYGDKACDAIRPKAEPFWPTPALAMSSGGPPDAALVACASWDDIAHDAFLFLGPRASLVRAPNLPDIYLDPAYRKEMDHQYRIKSGKALPIFPEHFPLRRAAYRDLDAPGRAELMDTMFARYDADKDGLVTEDEYRRKASQ